MSSQNKVFTDAVEDLKDAMAAHDKINPELKMATNGWVVGPLPRSSIRNCRPPGMRSPLSTSTLVTLPLTRRT